MGWSYTIDQLTVALEAQRPGDATKFSRVSTDTRTLKEGDVFFALSGPNFNGHDYVRAAFEQGAAAAVVEEEIPGGVCIIVPHVLEALQQFAAWHRDRYTIPVLAITGSCGKTSTKDLAAALLETKHTVVKTPGNFNNEIGCPLSLLMIDETTDAAVLELGANHPGEIARLCALARPQESAITMIAAAHLEGFGTIEDVARAKGEIVQGLPPDGAFYVNVADPRCVAIGEAYTGQPIRFGWREAFVREPGEGEVAIESCTFADDGEMRLTLSTVGTLRLPLAARAHATNVALAVAIGLRHGVTEFEAPLREACANATRFRVLQVGPFTVIDDTYNANPASAKAALEALADRPAAGQRIAVLGSMGELGETSAALHREVGEAAGLHGVDWLIARGPGAPELIAGAKDSGVHRVESIDDHAAIAEAILQSAQPGAIILVKGSRTMEMERVIEALSATTANASAN